MAKMTCVVSHPFHIRHVLPPILPIIQNNTWPHTSGARQTPTVAMAVAAGEREREREREREKFTGEGLRESARTLARTPGSCGVVVVDALCARSPDRAAAPRLGRVHSLCAARATSRACRPRAGAQPAAVRDGSWRRWSLPCCGCGWRVGGVGRLAGSVTSSESSRSSWRGGLRR